MINIDRELYAEDIKEWAFKAVDRVRPTVFLGPRQLQGRRFNDTAQVFDILESMATQTMFEQYPLASISNALREAASADFWYDMEKDYGNEIEDMHENDGEYDGADY